MFYLGGHEYANNNLEAVNGQRMHLNALFVAATTFTCPNLRFYAITGRVLLDDNYNGILDGGEGGFAGVTVTIVPVGGGDPIVVTTDENGFWSTSVSNTGEYTITMTAPDGTYITSANNGHIVNITGVNDFDTAQDIGLGLIDAVNDLFSTPVNTILNGDVSGNDIYETGSTFSIVTGPTNGTINFNSDGTFTYTLNTGFNGTETFTYQVCAPAPNQTVCDTATVTITIADLEIEKSNTPDVNTPVEPGDIITYSITVTNTGSAVLNSVDVTDVIPAGTVYVPNSVTFNINHPTLTLDNPALVSVVYNTQGSFNWVAPAGVTEVIIEAWGGGGASRFSDTSRRGGAGGGGYSRSVLAVNPSTSYSLQVGAGGQTTQQAGGDSWFSSTSTLLAKGGSGGADGVVLGGQASAGFGQIRHNGGSGGGRSGDAGGGGSAFRDADGQNGATASGTTGGAGGFGFGNGGKGGNINQSGQSGQFPGAGAGGNGAGLNTAVTGGNGQVIIYYIPPGATDNPPNLASGWILEPTSVLTVSYQVEVPNLPTEDVILNTATVSSNQLLDIDSNEVVNVVAPVAVFDEFTTPKDTELLGDVSLNDIYPPGATFSIYDQSGITHGSLTVNPDGTFSYTPGSGETTAVSFVYQVCAAAPYENVCDTETVYITIADLEITKSNNPDENTNVNPGGTITYTIVVKNNGSSTLTNISVEDVLPAGLTYVPGTVSALPTIFSDVFNASGTWTAPNGVTSINVQAWGAGAVQEMAIPVVVVVLTRPVIISLLPRINPIVLQ